MRGAPKRSTQIGDTERVFAWFPVSVEVSPHTYQLVWLEHVTRRLISYNIECGAYWEYIQ